MKTIKTFENFSYNIKEDFDYHGQHSAPSPLNDDLPMNDVNEMFPNIYTDYKRLKTFEGLFNFKKKENPSFSDISEDKFNELSQEIKDSLTELCDIGLKITPILNPSKRPQYVIIIENWKEISDKDYFNPAKEFEEILRFSTDYIRDFGIKLECIIIVYYDDINGDLDGTMSSKFNDLDKFFEFINHELNNNIDFEMTSVNLYYDI